MVNATISLGQATPRYTLAPHVQAQLRQATGIAPIATTPPPTTIPIEAETGTPAWVWALVAGGATLVVGSVLFFVFRRKKT